MSFKVLHLSTRDTGGAGIAALRLHKGMLDFGLPSKFLCLEKTSTVPEVAVFPKFFPRFYDRFLARLGMPTTQGEKNDQTQKALEGYFQPEMYSFLRSDYKIHTHSLCHWAEVIIIHWVAGFLDYATFFRSIPKDKKVFWYTHDYASILGGFHTLYDQDRFNHPKIKAFEADLKQKKRHYLSYFPKLNFIGNSQFSYQTLIAHNIADIGKLHCVPLGLPEHELKAVEKTVAKQALGFDADSFIILATSADLNAKRKGFDRLMTILETASKRTAQLVLVTLGNNPMQVTIPNIKIRHLGNVWHPQFKSIIFSAADVVMSTSYEETFGQTIIEGYACGTPALVFNNAALPELVKHGDTGYIAETIEDASNYLVTLYKNRVDTLAMGEKAYQLFKTHYTAKHQVERFVALFEAI